MFWLSQFRPGDVIVDGETFPGDELIWEINGVEYTREQMRTCGDVAWNVIEVATVKVKKPGGLSQGYHEINLPWGWICNYIDPKRFDPVLGINFSGFNNPRRLLIV